MVPWSPPQPNWNPWTNCNIDEGPLAYVSIVHSKIGNFREFILISHKYSKTGLKQSLERIPKIGFLDQLLLTASQKYCRMLHSAILLTCIKPTSVFKTFVLSIFEWPFKTGFTVALKYIFSMLKIHD